MLLKGVKEDTKRWKDIPYSQIRRLNIVQMSIISKAIYRFNAIPQCKANKSFFLHKFKNLSKNSYGISKDCKEPNNFGRKF